MGKNLPYARNLLEFLDLRIFTPELFHCLKGSFLHGFGFIHEAIETMKLIADMKMLHPFEIIITAGAIDGLAYYINNTPVTVHSFDLVLQHHLLIAKIDIVLNRRLKDGAVIIFRMIHPVQLPQSQKTAQLVGVNLISFVGTAVDQGVLPGIRGDDFGYIRPGYPSSPIGKVTFFQCQILLFCLNSFEGLDNVALGCRKSFVAKESSVKIHVAQDTVTGMYIYCQICYLFHRTTSFVVYVVGAVITLYTTVVRFSFNQRTAGRTQRSEVKGKADL